MTRQLSIIIVAIILSLGLILSAAIFSYSPYQYNRGGGGGVINNRLKTITVTGYAEKQFFANFSVLKGTVNVSYLDDFKKYLVSKGIKLEDVNFSSSGNSFVIESEYIHKVVDLYKSATEAKKYGVIFTNPEFYCTNDEDIKIQLLIEATKNAKSKAGAIAENSGSKLGTIVKSEVLKIRYLNLKSNVEFENTSDLNIFSNRKRARILVEQIYEVQ